ncbi:unnamed protein product [Bursaphelenchus okinawaensis]|uniref:Uncharacterized protein n=1 Tax=Bursaphelenchus okinawaensis TaxID=465554 RepID=A0A811JPV2_9BILA|nr:unnamed protein product [Bursaphelenchus okinawaensis]CAD5205320.1 unnamed protein product [Bursaphelenchus okinawaensis]CAD5205323.1 unnamed protein product [Bursaphelenchus okinawaensis]CAD5205329.1 unnamed protein product [Bursaphelenchus okinawaensis]CAD5205332.1 unnamed protein product [Bursaphelenchus okinawaensis]
MIGRADIEGSKSNVAMDAWLPQASYPCGNFSDTSCCKLYKSKGSIGHAFAVCIRTENQDQPKTTHAETNAIEVETIHLQATLLAQTARRSSPSSHERSPQASRNNPTNPISRANSFPKVTNLICRLPLSTLFHQLEAAHLGDLLRILVRSCEKFIKPPLPFQGPHRVHETPQQPQCYTAPATISPDEPIPWS